MHFQLKQLPSMIELRVLHMRNTQRNSSNVPLMLDNLINLEDVDFSQNDLRDVPDALLDLKNLRKLNLSDNQISKLPDLSASTSHDSEHYGWNNLEILNLSG